MTWQRIWPARGVVPKTLPITAILAGLAVKAAAHAQKVLVNGWQALRRPSTEVPVAGAEHDCSVSLGQWRCSERGGPDPIDTASRTPVRPHRERPRNPNLAPRHRITAHSLENRPPHQGIREAKINNTT